ncbi:aminotransferase class IV [Candidatus Synchoanobacter obligatus]|uniref:branched-chain-amino-acid transaminase n=1 Tax=Candidatus Synchoanobacter obligatus TaxID=2919597 RepID=A0ABT1L4V1_9GAMM|nr:aminotransferase class IV [Candidatus Synchoanobacter obligatus]MCP8351946.1 aminotransferase class IV [Candidatus Synchoanobacter obligatus]
MVPVSINGVLSPPMISVFDRGFLFGESAYEVIPVYHQQPFQIDDHLARLQTNCQQLSQITISKSLIKQWIFKYLSMVNNCDNLYVQITPGAIPIRNHLSRTNHFTCIIHQSFHEKIDFDRYKIGFNAITVADTRSSHSHLKSIQLALNTQALQEAHARGYDDAIFIKNGYITEAASSNVFAVINQTLVTPPTQGIVAGLTRHAILNIAKNNQLKHCVRPLSLEDLQSASEVFLSSSIKLLKPIKTIEKFYQNLHGHPYWEQLFQLLMKHIDHATHQTQY